MCEIFGQFWHGYHGKALADARTFDGIVIDKDQAVDARCSIASQYLKVFGFVVPIYHERRDVRPPKQHFGMVTKRGFRDRGVVLASRLLE